ncbi:hypothetical protein K2173_020926 [Erythroxylum novogranatense]|uniref:Uncharacterized protein n=1 Tax=Erythroxylum novogranatense TaxID=1862640 RepID=A0AAV8TNE9_9ROSI|nr:hypothetical protein K2173_020926 [Erythroxylum novogranatense]
MSGKKKSDPYETVKGGRLTFKGGGVATTSKSIHKKHKKNKKKQQEDDDPLLTTNNSDASQPPSDDIYTIDAAKKMKYEELFPVEAKKFGYHPKSDFKSVEDALDDRVKKKADRYCK